MKKYILVLLALFCSLQLSAQIFHEDFEVVDSVTYSSNGASNWAQNNNLFSSGNFCDSASLVNPGDFASMTTIPFSTTGYGSVYLYFNQIAKVEFFDACTIEF